MKYNAFLENYRRYTQGNETPELIHIWCGLAALAGAIEKRMWIDQKFFKLYFNLYILLLAPAGVAAKSTSMGIALKMLKEAGLNIMEGSILKEKIIEDLETLERSYAAPTGNFNHSSVTFVSNELNVLLASGVDMIKFLVDIYDRDDTYVYKTKKSGSYEIKYPYFNMLAAAVPQWFGDNMATDMGATGLLARFIIIYEEQKRGKVPRLRITPEQEEARARCMDTIYALTQMHGEMGITPEAEEFFCTWYMKQDSNVSNDYRLNSYFERRNKIHILKVAALMALGDVRTQIEVIDFERAIHLLERTEVKMRLAYIMSGGNKLTPYIHQVLNMLDKNKGRMPMFEIVQLLYHELDIEDVKKLISTMEDMHAVKKVITEDGKWLVKT